MKLSVTKEWFEKRAALEGNHEIRACNCIGAQNGAPVCPCRMEGVTVENGRYVERRDLGPVTNTKPRNLIAATIRKDAADLEPRI